MDDAWLKMHCIERKDLDDMPLPTTKPIPPSRTRLVSCCRHCNATDHLIKCAKCQVVMYCDETHQAADWEQHKASCEAISRHMAAHEAQVEAVRMAKDELRDREKASASRSLIRSLQLNVGYEEQEFVELFHKEIPSLGAIHTAESLQVIIDRVVSCMLAFNPDALVLWSIVPALLLQLGRHEEALQLISFLHIHDYEECSWYEDKQVVYGEAYKRCLPDLVKLQALSPMYLCRSVSLGGCECSYAFSVIMLVLMKVNLMLEMKDLKASLPLHHWRSRSGDTLPLELINEIQNWLGQNYAAAVHMRQWPTTDIDDRLSELVEDIDTMYRKVDRVNFTNWPSILGTADYWVINNEHERDSNFVVVRWQEVEEIFGMACCRDAWLQHPRAMAYLRELRKSIHGGRPSFARTKHLRWFAGHF